MTYDDYIFIHKKDREEADGCDMCKYGDREPWEFPCIVCKRNCMDLYERDTGKYGERIDESDVQEEWLDFREEQEFNDRWGKE